MTRSKSRIQIALSASLTLLLLGGCNFLSGQKKCSSNKDCPSNGYCDTAQGSLCYLGSPDGGNGGGICSPACGAWQDCVIGVNTCQARYSFIAINQPVNNTTVGKLVNVIATLNLNPGFSRNDPASLVLAVNPGAGQTTFPMTLTTTPGVYQYQWSPPSAGSYVLEVRYAEASLKSADATVTADFSVPTFTVALTPPTRIGTGNPLVDKDPAFTDAYRKDEKVQVTINSSATNVDPASVALTVIDASNASYGPYTVTRTSAGNAPYIGTSSVDLATIPLNAFRAAWNVNLKGSNSVGNGSPIVTQPFHVSRFKWAFSGDNNFQTRSSPAVGNLGAVYFGTTDGTSTGSLYALLPSGKQIWKDNLGAVKGTPAVGKLSAGLENIYAAATTFINFRGNPFSDVYSLGSADGNASTDCNYANTEFKGAIALVPAGASEAAVAISSQPKATILNTANSTCTQSGVANSIAGSGALVTDGMNVSYGDTQRNVSSYTLSNSQLVARNGWQPISVNSVPNLALNGGTILGTSLGQAFTVSPAGGSFSWQYTPAASASVYGNPVMMLSGSLMFGTDLPSLIEIGLGSSTPSPPEFAESDPILAAPVLGQGGSIYTVSTGGKIEARTASNLSPAWSLDSTDSASPGPTDATTNPNIDCARDAYGATVAAKPGTLYVSSKKGIVSAYVVDSPGIDSSAPWPKFQHDPRNTGNSTTSLAPFSCP